MDPQTLPRAVALQFDKGELVYPAGHAPRFVPYSYNGCGLRAFGKNVDFDRNERFLETYRVARANAGRKGAHIDDNRWILHVVLWAAQHAAKLPGDFVECGVDTGMFSTAICKHLDFNALDKDFWLFDTYQGIPDEQMTDAERNGIGGWHNRNSYDDCYEAVLRAFAPWPRAKPIRGMVPETLVHFPAERKVAYLSIDMNIVVPEIAAMEFFWDKLVPGAVVVLDDYAWATHAAQKEAFDAFFGARGHMVLSVPTGQGIVIRC